MTLANFLALRGGPNHQFNEVEQASFRARGGHLSWYSTQTPDALPACAKRCAVRTIPPCIRSGFPAGAITKAWRTPQNHTRFHHYYLLDSDGDLQSVS